MGPFRKGHFAVLFTASIGIPLSAQVSGTPASEAQLRAAFDNAWGTALPQCDVTPVRPEMGFSLRFQSGFSMSLPPGEYDGPHQYGVLLLRITPEKEQPAYISTRVDLSDRTNAKLDRHIHGSFVVAEGNYNVEVIFGDYQHPVCRSQWRMDARLPRNQHLSPVKPAPGAEASGRLTVLMQVAPPSVRAAKLQEGDLLKLLGTLSALLEQPANRTLRLIVVNLEQQKVLFRKDEFSRADVQNLAKLIDARPSGVVDYSALQNPRGDVEMLTQLTETERCELGASDSLVFLGLHMQVPASIRSGTLKKLQQGPRVFYLEYEPPPSLAATPSSPGGISAESSMRQPTTPEEADLSARDYFSAADSSQDQSDPATIFSPGAEPDIIQQLVKQLKGETIQIRNPEDCARAIRRIAASAKKSGAGD